MMSLMITLTGTGISMLAFVYSAWLHTATMKVKRGSGNFETLVLLWNLFNYLPLTVKL